MSATILVQAGRRYYKVRVNPTQSRMTHEQLEKYACLMRRYITASRCGHLKMMIRIERRIRDMEKGLRINPFSRRSKR